MSDVAKVSSKGQLTIPKHIRDTLELGTGDSVVFALEDGQATLRKIPSLLDLASSVPVPPDKRGAAWKEIRAATRRKRSEARS
jgi:AbrB family looped-hinge helix DNA binding protein